MLVSTIIPTIGRSTLDRTVRSVLQQEFSDDWEIIVVNDSGKLLPESDYLRSPHVRVMETVCHERSVARNTGAAVGNGIYFYFLDDDDWLLPGGLRALGNKAQSSKAAWVYGSTQLVDTSGNPLIQLHHGLEGNLFTQVLAGEWIPLQSSLIQANAFFDVGGFNPLVSGPEDIDLCRRIALRGDFAETPNLISCVRMQPDDTTTDYKRHASAAQWAREAIFEEPGVFARMKASACSPYWRGRIVRAYLTSTIWNLRRWRGMSAASRTVYGIAALLTSVSTWWSPSYWHAIATNYQSETFRRGFEQTKRSA